MIQATNLGNVGQTVAGSPCGDAKVPNLVGKTVKEVTVKTTSIRGKRVNSIALKFTDGTYVMGIGHKDGDSPPITTDGYLIVVSDQGCSFLIRRIG